MAQARKKTGFTLMELVLVLVVLAILATIATPALRGFTRSRRLPNTAQELVTAARWCRVQAISDATTYRLNLDVENNRWSITKDDGTGTNYVSVTTDFIQVENALPDGISMQTTIPTDGDGNRYIAFAPNGKTDLGTIKLLSDNVEVDVTCDTPLSSYYVVKAAGT